VRNKVIDLMQDLYFTEREANAVLIKIGYRPSRIPAFHDAATFWTQVVLQLERGAVIDGFGRLLSAAQEDHPGDRRAATLRVEFRMEGRGPVTVLALFADAHRRPGLRIDEESRLLTEIAAGGGIEVHTRHAVRTSDIQQALLGVKPRILHFGGHGTLDGLLEFDGGDRRPAEVAPTDFARVIAAASDGPLEAVVLNSCYTGANAAAFRGATRAVAGAVDALPDNCALAFARGFYTSVAAGQPVEKAYENGTAQAGIVGCDTGGLHFEFFSGNAGDR